MVETFKAMGALGLPSQSSYSWLALKGVLGCESQIETLKRLESTLEDLCVFDELCRSESKDQQTS